MADNNLISPINQLETLARDLQSLIEKANINPTLIKTICCRECFSLYPPNRDASLFCTYLPYPHEEQCGETLFKQNQSILTWVTWLLSKPDTEKEIQEWAGKVGNQDIFLTDVQNGTAFKTLFSKDQSNSLDLALSLFVNWFNPHGNKIAESVESSGVFAFSCLNLPPSTQNKVSHIGLAGITPDPFSPNTKTINHLLKPWNLVLKSEHISILMVKRSKDATLVAAQLAKDSTSSTESENLLKESGVQWSELNRLSYWNPSDKIVLGDLHNWLEGILQAHFQYLWGFKSITKKESKKRRRSAYAQSRRKQAQLGGATSAMSLEETSENSRLEDSSDESNTDLVLDGGPDGPFFSQNNVTMQSAPPDPTTHQ
ncbi:uncharacterized protein PGTG_19147 [Puccinia graminis f. sp. tritici CRL 75-36-700-3]|uniref:Uncharacterized protein n=1 Tax=Puccinia graminis f. sp. tritici (strain CRL 75-36-700-3 / race SCCL) TaxID=418459 RepID=E3L9A6_PUCGT|nr:uncharacterized protein PGTG_19147 [Puccinia graminis f. sp. tritici CRL 75-36-700-3]EFP93131.1 hypothetical protein PGTG_19147 [Puccinia graminis f. sp. tritici CRL 75-36-700-3]